MSWVQESGRNPANGPFPETKWTPFYLHEGSLLSEHEFWPNEPFDSFEDSPWGRGYVEYYTPPLVEKTEVIGPLVSESARFFYGQ